jgi:hypothetical protein
LQSLAAAHGFGDGKRIFDDPDNDDLRKKRKSPADVAPGDLVVIPKRRLKTVRLQTGKVHTILVKRPSTLLRVQVCDETGQPLGAKPYQLTIGGRTIEATTTAEGVVEQSVPVDAKTARLVVHEAASRDQGRWAWRLRLAALAGPETRRGSWQRLVNLGYWSSSEDPAATGEGEDASQAADDSARDPMVLALRAFQHDEKLEETGRLDDATRARLVERHGI